MSKTITYVSDSGYSYLTATIDSGTVNVNWIYDSFSKVNDIMIFDGEMTIPEFTRFLTEKDWMEVSEVQVELGESWPPEGFEEDMKEMTIYERYTPGLI